MTFDVAIDGRPCPVAVEPFGRSGRFTVVVGGTTRIIDGSWVDADTLSLIDAGAVHEVRLHQREEGVLDIAIGGRSFVAVVGKQGQRNRTAGVGIQDSPRAGRTAGPRAVKAPMPGRIVRVLVSTGDRVTARQPVIIVEAMKMENEIRSSEPGVVKEVNVQEGDAIDAGAVLLVIEYAASV